MQLARKGIITEAMKQVAAYEGVTEEFIRKGVAEGTIAIPLNINHKNVTPRGVGQGLSVKVNANIGTSSSYPDPEPELEKLAAAIAAGADSVMDLSTGDNIELRAGPLSAPARLWWARCQFTRQPWKPLKNAALLWK